MPWLYRQKKSPFWWIGWRVGKKSFFRSTKQVDRAEAEKELEKATLLFGAHRAGTLEEVYRALSGTATKRVPYSAVVTEWLSEVLKSNGKGTARKYRIVCQEFTTYLGADDVRPLIHEIGAEHIRKFLNQNRAKLTAKTTNLKRAVLSLLFASAVEKKIIRENPVKEIRRFKAGDDAEAVRRPFTIEELRLVYSNCPTDFWRYMTVGGFYTGQRMGDLVLLEWQRVDFVANIIKIKSRKTKTHVQIPMEAPLRTILKDVHTRARQPKTGYVWPDEAALYLKSGSAPLSLDFYNLVMVPAGLVPERKFFKRTGTGKSMPRRVTPLSYHSFRHSFVSLLKATGGSQSVAKELAGHSSDLISDNYTKLPPEVLRKAIAALPRLEESK